MTEPYIPELNIKYPPNPDDHMGDLKVVRNVVVDENFPFLDRSFKGRFMRFVTYGFFFPLVMVAASIRCGLKIEGRKNLRKHKKLFKDGAMTISNHVHYWDMIMVLKAIRFRTVYIPVWKDLMNGPSMRFVRGVGGIPIPDTIQAIKNFNKAFDEVRAKKKWLHAYPESSRFDYYQPIRPFKKGVFTMAYRYNLPIVPMAFSYRPPAFPYTLLNALRASKGGQKLPMMTLRVGEPILFDSTLGRKEAVQKMRRDCHEAVVRLAGITNNPYPPEGD